MYASTRATGARIVARSNSRSCFAVAGFAGSVEAGGIGYELRVTSFGVASGRMAGGAGADYNPGTFWDWEGGSDEERHDGAGPAAGGPARLGRDLVARAAE